MQRHKIETVSLDAIRVFTLCARHMSFSRAARQLRVSQGAVSRRIKLLEDDLGYRLFERNGRHLALTAKGAHLFGQATEAIDLLAATLEANAPGAANGAVSLALGQSLAHLWLSPRLRAFAKRFPHIPVDVRGTDDLAEIEHLGNDLAVIYGSPSLKGWMLRPLFNDVLVPAATPAYLRREGLDPATVDLSPAALSDLRLCDYRRANAAWVTLQDWANRVCAEPVRLKPAVMHASYMMALDAVLDDGGIMLGSRVLMADHFAEGRIVEVSSRVLDQGLSYHLGLSRRSREKGHARRLADFLVAGAASAAA